MPLLRSKLGEGEPGIPEVIIEDFPLFDEQNQGGYFPGSGSFPNAPNLRFRPLPPPQDVSTLPKAPSHAPLPRPARPIDIPTPTKPPVYDPVRGGYYSPDPLGELPPPYGPLMEEQAAQAAKNVVWSDIAMTAARWGALALSAASDFINLITYSAELGPSAQEEAAAVRAQLVPPVGVPAWFTVNLSEPNPFNNPDLQVDPYAEPTPAPQPIAYPAGLPGLATEPSVQTVTVTATRPATGTAAFALPDLSALSGTLLQPGVRIAPATRAVPKVGTSVLAQTPISGLGLFNPTRAAPSTETRPRVGFPLGTLALTGLAQVPAQDFQIPPGGTPANKSDCGGGKGDKKDKKKRKKRNVCWKGTYYERANGLTKFKRERIPCR